MRHYVAGLLFCRTGGYPARVALIRKNRPEWMAGRLNAIGGKLEDGESPGEAMVREFREETGLDIAKDLWRKFCILHGVEANGDPYQVHFYVTNLEMTTLWLKDLSSKTDEVVGWYFVKLLLRENIIPNLEWIIPMALDKDTLVAHVYENGTTED